MVYPETLQKALNSGDIIAIRAALIAIVDKDKNAKKAQLFPHTLYHKIYGFINLFIKILQCFYKNTLLF